MRSINTAASHDLAREVQTALGNTGGVRAPQAKGWDRESLKRDTRPPVLRDLGITFALLSADKLVGVDGDGKRRNLGACRFNQQRCVFDIWIPHFGVAIDTHEPDEDIRHHKAKWCASHSVFYIWQVREKDDLGQFRISYGFLRPDDNEEELVGFDFVKAVLAKRRVPDEVA